MIIIIIFILVVGVLAIAANKPDTFRVERTVVVKAPPEKIFPLINDFHHWVSWSPYEKMDPVMKRTYSGAPSGKGAVYEWEGNKKVGTGRMEITEALPPAKIILKLDFFAPFEGHHTGGFILEARGEETFVVWYMQGLNSYMAKLMCLFVNMDHMIGKDFEVGLVNLKSVVENSPL